MNEENPQHQMDANMLVEGREYYVVTLDNNRQPDFLHNNNILKFEEKRNESELIFTEPNGQEVIVYINDINPDNGPLAIYHHGAGAIQALIGGGANDNNNIPLNNQIPQDQIPQDQIPHGGRRRRRHHKKYTRRHKSGRKHKKTRRH